MSKKKIQQESCKIEVKKHQNQHFFNISIDNFPMAAFIPILNTNSNKKSIVKSLTLLSSHFPPQKIFSDVFLIHIDNYISDESS